MQLNIDEFYVGNPKAFYSSVPRRQDLVWGIMVEYVLTDKDVGSIDFSLAFEKLSLCCSIIMSGGRNPAPSDIEMV